MLLANLVEINEMGVLGHIFWTLFSPRNYRILEQIRAIKTLFLILHEEKERRKKIE